MRKWLPVALGALLLSRSVGLGEVEVQSSWYLGAGELGPVPHWGESFYDSDSLAYSIPGQLTLMAATVDHNGWTRHVVEQNPGIGDHTNIVPVDLDNDGDLDLVAVVGGMEESVVWYERTSGTCAGGYSKHWIGDFVTGRTATTWPWDLDSDGDVDVVASGDEGLVWFENHNLSFTNHVIDTSTEYLYARPGDIENDGDVDVVVHDKSESPLWGDLWLFRNDGAMQFSREFIYDATLELWRINLADFNGDGFLDIQTSMKPVYVFLNDSTGHFTRSFTYGRYMSDGSWPNDFDADGDVDIMVAAFNGPLFWLENDGTGTGFEYHVIGGESGEYGDGGMATDVNLDGLMDALGTYEYVGWFEQREDGGFVEHQLPDGHFPNSHWVYGENLDGGPCIGDVDIDILATKGGEFAWWENRMVTFAAQAWLESSILDGGGLVSWARFGWDDHVPGGNELRYRVRSGVTVAELLAAPWSSPLLCSGDSLAAYGVRPGAYFQYRLEFERTTGAPDRSPTVYEVWVEITFLQRPGLVTGGGWIPAGSDRPGDKRTFGFNAHTTAGATWGQLQFIDHVAKLKVHSDTVKALVIHEGDTVADFSGDCRVREHGGELVLYTFECRVMDRDEPGRGVDWFGLDVYDGDGSLYFSASEYLGGGNIQIHTEVADGLGNFASDTEAEPGQGGYSPQATARKPQILSPTDEPLHSSPNPLSSSTTIFYTLPSRYREKGVRTAGAATRRGGEISQIPNRTSHITLAIYDLSGRHVCTLLEQPLDDPTIQLPNQLAWDAKDKSGADVATGVYICCLRAGGFATSRKLVVLR